LTASILVVDDDPEIRAILRLALVQVGFGVTEAWDGAAGLAAAERGAPDLNGGAGRGRRAGAQDGAQDGGARRGRMAGAHGGGEWRGPRLGA